MPVKRAAVNPEAIPTRASNRRLVTPEDATEIMKTRGTWFDVETSSTTRTNLSVMTTLLRRRLPGWYGGKWETMYRDSKLYCRFLG